jgi:hypothetical protein
MKAIPGPSGGGDLEAFHTRCVLNRGKHANVACWHLRHADCMAQYPCSGEQAYRRRDALEKHRKLMDAWVAYCER